MIELQEIRTLARDFATSELRPHVEGWDHEAQLGAGVAAQLAELGFFGLLVEESAGGMGMGLPEYVAALEEIAWGEPAAALLVMNNHIVASVIEAHGSEEQRGAWLERLATGGATAAIAIGADDELGAEDVEATASNGGFELHGEKPWVMNGSAADVLLVHAQTAEGNAFFLVPGADAQVGERADTLGLRPLHLGPVRFDGVRVDAAARVGRTADEAALAPALRVGAASVAAISLGIAQAALDHARAYADEREQFGTKLRNFEAIQIKLANMMTQIAAARALLLDAAERDDITALLMAKVNASAVAMDVTTQAVQVFGGYGYMRDYPVEKLMRDAKAMELLQGANEGHRVQIARSLYA